MGTEVLKVHIKGLYEALSEHLGQTPDAFHYDHFGVRSRELYYRSNDKSNPLTKLRVLGLNIPLGLRATLMHQETTAINSKE